MHKNLDGVDIRSIINIEDQIIFLDNDAHILLGVGLLATI
jgi:hypothetical protein